jgi:hypothetical protein
MASWKGTLEWTEEQADDFNRAVAAVLDEDGQAHTDEIMYLELWDGEWPFTLVELLDQVSYATHDVGVPGRTQRRLTSAQKERIQAKLENS